MSDYLAEWEAKIDPGFVKVIRRAGEQTTADFVRATRHRVEMQQKASDFFRQFDLLLTPTMTMLPFSLGY